MHDALAQYEETIVEDVDDDWKDEQPIRSVAAVRLLARSRVPTGDLAMHVQLDDGWHREDVGGVEVACGPHINERLVIERKARRKIEHPLAPCECWTTRERQKADEAYRERFGQDFDPAHKFIVNP